MINHYSGSGPIAENISHIDPGQPWRLHEVRLHLSSAAAGGDLTVAVSARVGAAHNVLLASIPMTGQTDAVWVPPAPINLDMGDSVTVAWPNSGSTTWGMTAAISAA